jgi:hypothetical protein
MLNRAILLVCALVLAGCAKNTAEELALPAEPIGNFKLGHAEVVAPNIQKLLASREASSDEWIAAVDGAIEARLRRFEGSQFYHIGVSGEAYSLPPPLVPGKSALSLRVTVWSDATQSKLNDETHVINIMKVIESRITKTRETQIQGLAEQAAKELEDWLRSQAAEEGWFADAPEGGAEDPATSE